MLQVVTTDVGHGLCPIPYPRKSTLCAQSRGPGFDNGCWLHFKLVFVIPSYSVILGSLYMHE
jgi:hypothetical protein